MDEQQRQRDPNHVQAVGRALDLLEALGAETSGLRLSELARACGLSTSTAHRLLTTMQSRGFVQFDAANGDWHVGQKAFSVGAAYTQRRNIVAACLPYLRHLRDQTRETANLGVLVDGRVTILTQVESREITRAITRVGGQVPATVSGMGKAMLAAHDDKDIAAMLGGAGPALGDELAGIRSTGYAVDDEAYVEGLRCIAAAVHDHLGEPLCAISISGLTSRITPQRIPVLGGLVLATARRLTEELGGKAPA